MGYDIAVLIEREEVAEGGPLVQLRRLIGGQPRIEGDVSLCGVVLNARQEVVRPFPYLPHDVGEGGGDGLYGAGVNVNNARHSLYVVLD